MSTSTSWMHARVSSSVAEAASSCSSSSAAAAHACSARCCIAGAQRSSQRRACVCVLRSAVALHCAQPGRWMAYLRVNWGLACKTTPAHPSTLAGGPRFEQTVVHHLRLDLYNKWQNDETIGGRSRTTLLPSMVLRIWIQKHT